MRLTIEMRFRRSMSTKTIATVLHQTADHIALHGLPCEAPAGGHSMALASCSPMVVMTLENINAWSDGAGEHPSAPAEQ
jgi:hypothetical protein